MNLVIDLGNTSAKVGIFEGLELVRRHTFDTLEELHTFLHRSIFHHVIVSAVRHTPDDVLSWCNNPGLKLVMGIHLNIPVTNRYKTPKSLGVDRLAAACGAAFLYPGKPVLVVDMGTCINYEFINDKAEYLGGIISPGLQMRFQAMHTFTARLPLVQATGDVALTGNTTDTCMQSGAVNGMLEEVRGIINRYKGEHPDLVTLLCGGDANRFEGALATIATPRPDLILTGLNTVLLANLGGTYNNN